MIYVIKLQLINVIKAVKTSIKRAAQSRERVVGILYWE